MKKQRKITIIFSITGSTLSLIGASIFLLYAETRWLNSIIIFLVDITLVSIIIFSIGIMFLAIMYCIKKYKWILGVILILVVLATISNIVLVLLRFRGGYFVRELDSLWFIIFFATIVVFLISAILLIIQIHSRRIQ